MLRLRRFKTLLMVCYAKIYICTEVYIYSVDPFDRGVQTQLHAYIICTLPNSHLLI